MAKLLPSSTGGNFVTAVVPRTAFTDAEVEPSAFPAFCSVADDDVHVRVSPAGRDYLKRLGEQVRDVRILEALPYAQANRASRSRGGPPRIWSTDFALAQGETTEDRVARWHARNGVTIRSRGFGTLFLPQPTSSSSSSGTGGDWWMHERNGTTFLLPGGRYRTGRAGTELFQQLLESLPEPLVKDVVAEAIAWSSEARRRFGDRAGPTRASDGQSITVEAMLRAVGASWDEAGQLGKVYRPPSARADLSRYLAAIRR